MNAQGTYKTADTYFQPQAGARRPWTPADWLGLSILLLFLIVGLSWSKWLPYWERTRELSETSTWAGVSLFHSAGETVSVSGAWNFTVSYFGAVWKALLVALFVAATIDALLRRDWLIQVMNRSTALRQSLTGALFSMPSMMCTCCAAPVTAGLRRSGVSSSAALAYWVGNPLLNPAVIVFLALVLPWQFAATRLFVGLLIATGASALIGRWFPGRTSALSSDEDVTQLPVSTAPMRFLRSLSRIGRVMVPEHLITVFVMGLLSPWLTGLYDFDARFGVVAVVVAAIVGVALVIPTAGEIPIVTALLATGVGTGTAGALLVALPALSVPSMVMVGKALGWRSVLSMAVAVAVGAVLAGVLLMTTV